ASGTVDVAGEVGGSVNVLGERVGLFDAKIEASGIDGGGNVRIGGDYQGVGNVPNASYTFVSEDSVITADAIDSGDGGEVIVWGDQVTQFYGSISARGGSEAGDGGLVEVSGKELLIFTGSVDAGASNGQPGTLLLDPENLTISDANAPLVTFLNPDPTVNDFFGVNFSTIAAVGTNVLIGVSGDDPGGIRNAGAAYLFDGETGELLRTFVSPNPGEGNGFGRSVAAFGNNVLIGAFRDDPGGITDAGAVYLFDSSTGELLQTFTSPNPAVNDVFGLPVVAVGKNVLVGARLVDSGGVRNAGAAYLFDGNTGELLQTFNNPDPGINDQFGSSVAGVGSTIFVAAILDDSGGITDSGAVYSFDSSTGELLQTFNNPDPGVLDGFGTSLTTIGTKLILGAVADDTATAIDVGAVYLFDTNTGELLQTINNPNPEVSDGRPSRFGSDITAVGNNVLVGAWGDDTGAVDSGIAYLFDTSTGKLLQTINNPNPTVEDLFGNVVAAIGTNVVVSSPFDDTGAENAGVAYLFPTSFRFNDNPSQTSVIDTSTITNITNTGTDVVMQANSDLTVDRAIITNNPTGEGGAITFQAGRSILINADITTDNGNLNLIANESLTNGVVNAERNPGNAIISVAPGVTINSGTGDTTVILGTGEGLTNNSSGDITLGNLIAGNVEVQNNGANGGGININGAIAADGQVTMLSSGSISTRDITTNTGEVSLTSQNATINTSNGIITTNGGQINFTANSDITTNSLDSSGINSGNITITSQTGSISTRDITTNAGEVSLTSQNATIDTSNGAITTNGGRINFAANSDITTNSLDSSGINSGNITLTSQIGNIFTGDITTNAGEVSLTSQNATIDTSNGIITTNGGRINFAANSDITTNSIDSSGINGGNITLTSQTGKITTGNLTSLGEINGGNILVEASTQITAEQINSSGNSGRGGNVTLDPSGDIQVSWINTQGGTLGGNVDITTASSFRVTDTFTAANGLAASISTIGNNGGGSIIIHHGGNGLIPFDVGNATINGTAGAITSGEFTIAPFQSFPFTYTEGNIQIISIEQPINPVDISEPQQQPSLTPITQQIPNLDVDIAVEEVEGYFTNDFQNHW
ncbi:MAG: hypothetical protein F6K41_34040, partial [Symploca sp. SIO3E6]|nr:hypothetical protein [Caldora sp. SIO3E6]